MIPNLLFVLKTYWCCPEFIDGNPCNNVGHCYLFYWPCRYRCHNQRVLWSHFSMNTFLLLDWVTVHLTVLYVCVHWINTWKVDQGFMLTFLSESPDKNKLGTAKCVLSRILHGGWLLDSDAASPRLSNHRSCYTMNWEASVPVSVCRFLLWFLSEML